MQKAAPSFGRIAVMAGFALSCFGLLLFLWLAFGGTDPAEAEGLPRHRVVRRGDAARARRPTCGSPACRSARSRRSSPTRRRAAPTSMIQLDSRYAPLPSDARGDPAPEDAAGRDLRRADAGHAAGARRCPRAARCRPRRSPTTVELDEIFRSFDPKTRAAFQEWMQTQAQAIEGHGRDINDALGNLGPFAEDAATLVDILNRQERRGAAPDLEHRRRVRRADRARRPAARR